LQVFSPAHEEAPYALCTLVVREKLCLPPNPLFMYQPFHQPPNQPPTHLRHYRPPASPSSWIPLKLTITLPVETHNHSSAKVPLAAFLLKCPILANRGPQCPLPPHHLAGCVCRAAGRPGVAVTITPQYLCVPHMVTPLHHVLYRSVHNMPDHESRTQSQPSHPISPWLLNMVKQSIQ